MGGICGCANDANLEAMKGLAMEQKANIGADRIKKEKYTGPLFTLSEIDTESIISDKIFAAPNGPFVHFFTNAKITSPSSGTPDMVSVESRNKTIIMAPNTQMELSMYVVEGIFPDEDVVLRVRLELEPIKANDYAVAAELTYEAKATGGSSSNFRPVKVYKDTKVVDLGFEPN